MPSCLFPQEILRVKRDGHFLSDEQITRFVEGIADGSIADSQVGAFAMAVCLRGMSRAETVALTCAMTRSGEVLTWSGVDRPLLDKHSTGGVGDKVSLILAPLVAACGGAVPMISGRSLGHTGGTLDKLESIPGYTTRPDPERFRQIVSEISCAIVGQTADLAPADRRLYAIRDVTATVESIPLITASILSKKLAEGIAGLVLDVKVGSGAFMRDDSGARALAESLVNVARGAGLRTVAWLTDMNQVLGRTAGNALEVREAIDVLCGRARSERLETLTVGMATELLLLGNLAADPKDARRRLAAALASGTAAERFARMVSALGGPADLIDHPDRYLPAAEIVRPVDPERFGFVTAIDVRALGLVVAELGGGRRYPEDSINHAVGLDEVAGIGEPVGPDRPLARIHARDEAAVENAAHHVRGAFRLSDEPGQAAAIVRARLSELH